MSQITTYFNMIIWLIKKKVRINNKSKITTQQIIKLNIKRYTMNLLNN